MGNRLTKIYTRTGDEGKTGKADGSRIEKDDLLIQAIGDVDELNSQLALVICYAPEAYGEALTRIQNELFDIGAELAMECGLTQPMISAAMTTRIERELDEMNTQLPPLKEFILPGGGVASSHCHVARSICRRAERTLVALSSKQEQNPKLMAYINRLSDYLFVMARAISSSLGETEVYWKSENSR